MGTIGALFAVALILYAIPSTRRALLGGYYSDQLAALVTRTIRGSDVPDVIGVRTSCEAVSHSSQYLCRAHLSTTAATLSFTERWIGTVSEWGEMRVHRIGVPKAVNTQPEASSVHPAAPTIYTGMPCRDWLHEPASAQAAYVVAGTNPPVSTRVARLAVLAGSSMCIDNLNSSVATADAMVRLAAASERR
jgi:hypothetical protein